MIFNEEYHKVIDEIDLETYYVMTALSNTRMLQKSSIRTETIIQKLPPKHKHININKAIKKLRNMGIISYYRKKNWKIKPFGKKFLGLIVVYKYQQALNIHDQDSS